jgi:hypothetical protein
MAAYQSVFSVMAFFVLMFRNLSGVQGSGFRGSGVQGFRGSGVQRFRVFFRFFKTTERSDINKYSICNLQSSIPACPGWGSAQPPDKKTTGIIEKDTLV